MIKHKYFYAYDIQTKLGYNDTQFRKLISRIKKRHPHQYWFKTRFAQNGQKHLMIAQECKMWLDEVYFNKSKYYLDLEIDFFEKRVKNLEQQLGITHIEKYYENMTIKEIMFEYQKTRNSVDVAVHKMIKVLGSNVKYKNDNKIVIRSVGIKWIYEKYYRKEYLSELEYYKNYLETLYK